MDGVQNLIQDATFLGLSNESLTVFGIFLKRTGSRANSEKLVNREITYSKGFLTEPPMQMPLKRFLAFRGWIQTMKKLLFFRNCGETGLDRRDSLGSKFATRGRQIYQSCLGSRYGTRELETMESRVGTLTVR